MKKKLKTGKQWDKWDKLIKNGCKLANTGVLVLSHSCPTLVPPCPTVFLILYRLECFKMFQSIFCLKQIEWDRVGQHWDRQWDRLKYLWLLGLRVEKQKCPTVPAKKLVPREFFPTAKTIISPPKSVTWQKAIK